jgi:heavy metal translocating P-type ATPase
VSVARLRSGLERALLPVTLLGLAGGVVAHLAGASTIGDLAFATATVAALLVTVVTSIITLRERRTSVDLIALLALAGALALGELAAGAVIAVMLSGGVALERFASRRAQRELTALLARVPRTTHRETDGTLERIPVGAIAVGDRLVVRRGEVVPTDGVLLSDHAVLDDSALTGESRPVELDSGQVIRSGGLNTGAALQVRATTTAARSTYAGIVALVERAAADRSPFVRLADRYAGRFVALTVVLAGAAWLVSGDAVRALAVLVVATPCPLLLAAPAAIVGGVNAAARRGIIVKGGGALEALAESEIVLLDKTGTLTTGRPRVSRVQPGPGYDAHELLRLAGSLEQVSLHPFAPAVVDAAREVAPLVFPSGTDEVLGSGITGSVDGREVRIGRPSFVAPGEVPPPELRTARRTADAEGATAVHVAVDGQLAGVLVLQDTTRPEAPRAVQELRAAGIDRVVMVTGDRPEVAELLAGSVDVDRVLADRSPSDKVDAVRDAARHGRTVMVGDGVNDAPALAAADVGIAMGARGATAASETADVVLTADRLGEVAVAVRVARRTRRIARQSVLAGMGMSGVAMVVASLGWLAPVVGALVQELIDLVVILNALRAARLGDAVPTPAAQVAVPAELAVQHALHRRELDELDRVAGSLGDLPPGEVHAELDRVRHYLADELLPHELGEERALYPVLATAAPGEDPTLPMVRTHREIARRIRLFERAVDGLPAGPLDPVDRHDLQRRLWGLHAILALHVALEDELFTAWLAPAEVSDDRRGGGPAEAAPAETPR